MALLMTPPQVHPFLSKHPAATGDFSADLFGVPNFSLVRHRQHEGYAPLPSGTSSTAQISCKSTDPKSYRSEVSNQRFYLKRSNRGSGDSEDESDIENVHPRQKPRHSYEPQIDLACPYDKLDLLSDCCDSGCTNHRIPSISKLHHHLTRHHIPQSSESSGIPPQNSWRPSSDDAIKRVGKVECRSCRHKFMTRFQFKQINVIVHEKNGSQPGRVSRWYKIFQVLFPTCDLPHSPFVIPYADLPLRTQSAVQRAKADLFADKFFQIPSSICIISKDACKKMFVKAHSSDVTSYGNAISRRNTDVHSKACDTAPQERPDLSPQIMIDNVVRNLLYGWALRRMKLRLAACAFKKCGAGTGKGNKARQPQRQQQESSASPGAKVNSEAESPEQSGRERKRKRTLNSDGEDENEESDSAPDPASASRNQGHSASLLCPFHWHDPVVFSEHNTLETEYHSCGIVMLDNIARLKQHLRRVHQLPEYFCDRCFKTFKDKPSLAQHNRQVERCPVIEPERFERKMTQKQSEIINKRITGKTESDKWNFIFRTLFPHGDLPDSPYHDGISPFLKKRLAGALAKAFAITGINVTNADFNLFCATAMEQLRKELDTLHEDQEEFIASGSCSLTDAFQSMSSDSVSPSQLTFDTLSPLSEAQDALLGEIGQAEMLFDWEKLWPADQPTPTFDCNTHTEHEFASVF